MQLAQTMDKPRAPYMPYAFLHATVGYRIMLAWDDLQFFLAVAQHRTLSAAAHMLGVTQPTVGRRIASLERQLGADLFVRSSAGFMLTDAGRGMLDHAEAMRDHAARAESGASGRDLGVEGRVRITASEWMLRSVLCPTLAPLLRQHPGLELELLADARHLNLAKREADIALRPSEFQQESILQRAIGTLEFGLYASDSYLARHGVPDFESGASGHVFIDMSEELSTIVDRAWLPALVGRAHVAVRCNGREPMAALAASGLGFTALPCFLGDGTPGLRRLAVPGPSPTRKLWLGMHRAARRTPRIHVTAAFVAYSLQQLSPSLHPSRGVAQS
jgi:DNA-binding transcriptional LysR family regulator